MLKNCIITKLILAGLVLLGRNPLTGEEANFTRHDINATATYCACAAIDVNHDGKLDIVSGGFWYEAPTWKKHFLREVQEIRGRFDDYANLPMDVNDDGWMDVVSANYRSQSIYWVEHPGATLGTWQKHVVDTPGAMETGRLYDIDGDGHIDLLPNGTKFAAWWEVDRSADRDKTVVRWLRHDLPEEAAGHGVGFGDINGDGRGDIVSPNGWLEAPLDRRSGRWLWHPDFKLHRDGSIPMLVHDVDADGDNDLIWGRGHNIGLYWLEQIRSAEKTTWLRHVIDTSWAEPHSILLADMDGDGEQELVAGKRFMGHDGKDPAEYDPLVAYWYDFDAPSRTWRRHLISPGGPAGFGLDPKAVDIDQDGDIDILAAGRSGLYLLENHRLGRAADARRGPSLDPTAYTDHSELMTYLDQQGNSRPVTTPLEWAARRAHIVAAMQLVMGQLPDSSRRVPLEVKYGRASVENRFTRHHISYAAEPGDRVHAYLLVPNEIKNGRAPAALCLHQTTKPGKDEPVGLSGRPSMHVAKELADRGFVCIVPDYPSFGESTDYDFTSDAYVSGTMKAIWNNIRAVDLLESLPQVDHDRIAVVGHSLGGHNALFTSVFEQRLRAVVVSCSFTAFPDYKQGNLAAWAQEKYMPRVQKTYQNDPRKMPFDFHEVLAALAPRPVFINAPVGDRNFDVHGVRKVVDSANRVYALRKAAKALTVVYPDSGHDFPDDVRQQAFDWLQQNL